MTNSDDDKLKMTGEDFGRMRERIRMIEEKSSRRLMHPYRRGRGRATGISKTQSEQEKSGMKTDTGSWTGRLERDVYEKLGGLQLEFFMLEVFSKLKPEVWQMVKDLTLEEFEAFGVKESDYRVRPIKQGDPTPDYVIIANFKREMREYRKSRENVEFVVSVDGESVRACFDGDGNMRLFAAFKKISCIRGNFGFNEIERDLKHPKIEVHSEFTIVLFEG
jgi:hypothetical protein